MGRFRAAQSGSWKTDERSPMFLHGGHSHRDYTERRSGAIQLAKAALYAGVRLLMDKLNVDAVDRIRLAGAFGSHIDVKYAMILGLIPDCTLENVTSAGNAAGGGAHCIGRRKRSRGD